MKLESALVIELDQTINWSSALEESTGVLTSVDPRQSINYLDYATRDRQLLYRDLINASAVVKVSNSINQVWGVDSDTVKRPTMQGEPVTFQLPFNGTVAGAVDSTVRHVNYASHPHDASTDADADLYGRDALLFQVLAQSAYETLVNPPIDRIDTTGTVIPGVTAWSHAAGTQTPKSIGSSLPLNRDTFRQPDEFSASRDNSIAAYVSRLAQTLKNPFEFATRLYIKSEVEDIREADIYTLVREYWSAGSYVLGDEVFYVDGWYRALSVTSELPTSATDWESISIQTSKVFKVEPALTGRNKIVYNTATKTLQWFMETTDQLHVPQIFALSIPGITPGQVISTVASVPLKKDAQFYRQKASKLLYKGQVHADLGYLRSTALGSTEGGVSQIKDSSEGGLDQTACASLTVPGELRLTFEGVQLPPANYRVSLLVKPDSTVHIQGNQNTLGSSGTLGGYTFDSFGTTVPYDIALPPGAWSMQVRYTNLTGTADSFGVQSTLDGVPVLLDTVGLPFTDENGVPFENGFVVDSDPIALTPNGNQQTLNLTWTYGAGQLHLRELVFTSDTRETGRYHVSGSIMSQSGTSELDVIGQRFTPDVMPFEFTTSGSIYSPQFSLTWLEENDIPLLICQAQIESTGTQAFTPDTGGFEGYKNEMLERALSSVKDSYASSLNDAQSGTNTLPDFRDTANHNRWQSNSTDGWMSFIETYNGRLRYQENILTGSIVEGRDYTVIGESGSITYDSVVYSVGDTFKGVVDVTSFSGAGDASVDQKGAFIPSKPGYLGRPALVPLGLTFHASGTSFMPDDATRSIPTLQSCQPWMIQAGIYVADHDFWSPETI